MGNSHKDTVLPARRKKGKGDQQQQLPSPKQLWSSDAEIDAAVQRTPDQGAFKNSRKSETKEPKTDLRKKKTNQRLDQIDHVVDSRTHEVKSDNTDDEVRTRKTKANQEVQQIQLNCESSNHDQESIQHEGVSEKISQPNSDVPSLENSVDSNSLKSSDPDLISAVNSSLFEADGIHSPLHHSFPLILFIETRSQDEIDRVNKLLQSKEFTKINAKVRKSDKDDSSEVDSVRTTYELSSSGPKQTWEAVVEILHENALEFVMDYTHFLSHPGVLFIKNLSPKLVGLTENQHATTLLKENGSTNTLFTYLNENSQYHTLSELKLFVNELLGNAFVLAKFDNYLDADKVMADLNKSMPNKFSEDANLPLYINRYLNKRERGSANSGGPLVPNSSIVPSQTNTFDVVVFENLRRFFPDSTMGKVAFLLQKVAQFGVDIVAIYFPEEDKKFAPNFRAHISALAANDTFTCGDYGFVRFKQDPHLLHNVLRLLYYLSDLTWPDFVAFDGRGVRPLHESSIEEETPLPDGIQLTIGQFKHSQLLNRHTQLRFLSWDRALQSPVVTSQPTESFVQTFVRTLNYQETNIYINHLPLLFHNDDTLWEKFWRQFGVIKSAKIIKPQFYRSQQEARARDGKIGFVFYCTFKMAIRAILLTNDRVVTVPQHGHPILIQSSFALQKTSPRTSTKTNDVVPQSLAPLPYNKQGLQMVFPGQVVPVPTPPQYFNPYFIRGQPQMYFQQATGTNGALVPKQTATSTVEGQRKFNYSQSYSRTQRRLGLEDAQMFPYGYPYPYNPLQAAYYYDYNYEDGYESS